MNFKRIKLKENVTIMNLRKTTQEIYEQIDDEYNIELDLENLTYVSSITLGMINELYKVLRKNDGMLVLINVDEYLRNIFSLVGFDKYIRIESEELPIINSRIKDNEIVNKS